MNEEIVLLRLEGMGKNILEMVGQLPRMLPTVEAQGAITTLHKCAAVPRRARI